MAFNVEGALKDGYSRAEIADYLASKNKFDAESARKDNYSDDEIIAHLLKKSAPAPSKPAAPTTFEGKVAKDADNPGLIDRATQLVKDVFTPSSGSVMDNAPPVNQQAEIDKRLALDQGPISPEAVTEAQNIREGKAPRVVTPGVGRVVSALNKQGAPTLTSTAQRVQEEAFIAQDAQAAREADLAKERQRLAREYPITSSAAAGGAALISGVANIPSLGVDVFNQTFINPILSASGLKPMDRMPTAFGTEFLAKSASDYTPYVSKQGMGDAYKNDEFGRWLVSKIAANSPQMAMSLAAAFAPPLRALLLPTMGATAAGQSYAQGENSYISVAKGLIEIGTEMMPLKVFDRIPGFLKGFSVPKQNAVMAVAAQRLLQTGTVITANSLTNAIEETAAQFGGNVLDKYFQGKDIELTNQLGEAAVIGAATGGAMSAPQAVTALAGGYQPLTPEQEIARAIDQSVAGAQPAGTRQAAVAALNPQTYDQTLISLEQATAAKTAASEARAALLEQDKQAATASLQQAATASDAIAAAEQLAGDANDILGPVPPVLNMGRIEPTLGPVAEIQQIPGRIEPTMEAPVLPVPSLETSQQLDQLRLAPRPQRINGQPVASLSDDQLREVVTNYATPAITRRGAQVELDARAREATTTLGAPSVEDNFISIPEAEPAAVPNLPAAQADREVVATEARTAAQQSLERWAAANNVEVPAQLNPAPDAETAGINQIADALGSQFGGKLYAYHDASPTALNGLALSGRAFVNTANVDINTTRTTLHELKHTVEQIALAEARQGLTDTPAQRFVAAIDSLYDDNLTEKGKRAYLEKFLAKAELASITDPAAREARIQELLADPVTRSEMTADFLGNRAVDKQFWADVAQADPEGFKGFVEKWLDIIDNLMATLRGKATQGRGQSAKVDAYMRDLVKAKMVAREALIAYRKDRTQGEQRETNIPAGAEGVQQAAERGGPVPAKSRRGELPSYGEPIEGAISVVGRHYSPRVQTSLSGNYYGTGIRGAEAGRLRQSTDSRIGNRIYFYVDTGKGIRPESGVGRFAHEVRLNNIYDPATRLIPSQPNANAFESAVIDAGFDGYIAPFGNGGAVVLLGNKHDAVPVQSLEEAPAFARKEKTTTLGEYEAIPQKDGSIMVKGDVDEIRGILPEGVVGRPVEGGIMFTPANAPRVRAALEGRKLAYSRGGAVVEKLPMKDGKYLGAPPKYNTPGKIGTLRKSLRKLTQEGAPGRYWYENSSRAILRMVGGNVQEARKFVALLAIYSPQAKVDANSTFALRAWAQYKAGLPISVKTRVMDSKAKAAMDDVDEFWSGEKTGNFFNNLLREIDPTTAGKQGATIDMWMMRAAEYPTDAPNSNQYAFMENETNAIAKELGWEPQQVQAAIWVAMKARMENSGVKKATEASSEKKGWIRYDYPLKNGKPFKTRVIIDAQAHRDNWLAHAFRHDPSKEDTQLAKFDFEDGVMRHLGQVSFEARPGRSTGVLPGIHDAPYAQQVEFQQAVQAAFLDDTGADRIAQLLGLLVDTNNILAPGVWQGEVSPSSQKLVAMAPSKGEEGKTSVDPAQAEALNLYAAVAGLVARQEGVGWHRPFFASTKRDANALDIDIGRVINPTEAADLERAIGVWMENNEKADWQDSFAIISSPKGVRLVNFGVVSNAVMQADIVQVAESALPDFDYRVFASSGDMPTNNWKENPNGESYVQRLSAAGRSDVLDWARTVLAPRVQSVFEEYSKKYDWGNPGKISFSTRERGATPARQAPEVRPADLQSVFAGLNKRGLAKTRAEAAVKARPDAAQINYVQNNFLDILSELEDSGKVKINCD